MVSIAVIFLFNRVAWKNLSVDVIKINLMWIFYFIHGYKLTTLSFYLRL